MSTPIYSGTFSSHSVLPSAQMNSFLYNINAHDHASNGGQPITFPAPYALTIALMIAAGLVINSSGYALYSP